MPESNRILLMAAFSLALGMAKPGDIQHVRSHDQVLVITDPSKGYNPYRNWTEFPDVSIGYRKVVLAITYARPDSLHCGEWDYIDNIYLRRTGGAAGPCRNIELARMISPYGWRFEKGWTFTWHADITDFAFLLHDSVEIEFNHTGYEANNDRGWLITLDFELTEGRPALECLAMDSLWCGSFPYGDTARPIEENLKPFPFLAPAGAGLARLRVTQTGHGMDDLDNCSEFCRKWRRIYFDDSLVGQRDVWRECGDNPLYPQAGTWIFDRANWCPGSLVRPDIYDYPVQAGTGHKVKVEMQPYANTSQPTANYYFYSYLFYLKPAWAVNDVALEGIVAPSADDEQRRQNPTLAEPLIRIRNQGRETLTSVKVRYGFTKGRKHTHLWQGSLGPQRSIELALPGVLDFSPGQREFQVLLSSPNGRRDEYPADNSGRSAAPELPVYPTRFVLVLRTNLDSTHNSYQLLDASGKVVKERRLGELQPEALFLDTFDLKPGGYQLVVTDTAGDGLDFWFNPEGGYGFVRLVDLNGRLIKNFISDFGGGIDHSFLVSDKNPVEATADLPIINLFPPRNAGMFSLDIFFDEPLDLKVRIRNEDSSRTVFEQAYPDLKDTLMPLDISMEPDGVYSVNLSYDDTTVTRKMKIERKE